MRAYYATYRSLRLFVFGRPEGWHTGIYDLKRKAWLPMDGGIYDTRLDAKAAVEAKARGLLGCQSFSIRWH
jgi:hypothetical protein